MEALKQAIKEKGNVRTQDILDVSQFLNGIVDAPLMQAIGKDFASHFEDTAFDVFVTVESSGIAPSTFASLHANKPLIVIKKENHEKDHTVFVQQPSFSYTKNVSYYLTTQASFLRGKRVILLDDFLANGNVVLNVLELLKKVDAELVATGICIAKTYQKGYAELTQQVHDVYCQVKVRELHPETQTVIYED